MCCSFLLSFHMFTCLMEIGDTFAYFDGLFSIHCWKWFVRKVNFFACKLEITFYIREICMMLSDVAYEQ